LFARIFESTSALLLCVLAAPLLKISGRKKQQKTKNKKQKPTVNKEIKTTEILNTVKNINLSFSSTTVC